MDLAPGKEANWQDIERHVPAGLIQHNSKNISLPGSSARILHKNITAKRLELNTSFHIAQLNTFIFMLGM